jgi:hypothetical protein
MTLLGETVRYLRPPPARLAGFDRTCVSGVERGERNPTP